MKTKQFRQMIDINDNAAKALKQEISIVDYKNVA